MIEFPPSRENKVEIINHIDFDNVKIVVNPYKGFGNKPYIQIMCECPNIMHMTYQYVASDGLYYLQTPEGYTDFFYHRDSIEAVADSEKDKRDYQTCANHEGFGSRTFDIRCIRPEFKSPIRLGVRGPWSGGCYGANNHLPKPATEVTFTSPSTYVRGTWTHTAGHLTVERVNQLLRRDKSLWMCKLSDESITYPKTRINPNGRVEQRLKVPEFVYAQDAIWFDDIQQSPHLFLKKEEWTTETLNTLDKVWQANRKI